jgi:hypothetical protein
MAKRKEVQSAAEVVGGGPTSTGSFALLRGYPSKQGAKLPRRPALWKNIRHLVRLRQIKAGPGRRWPEPE